MFCIAKNIQTLELSLLCCCTMKPKFTPFLLCFPPKWKFITFSGCNNKHICYLWLSNVHKLFLWLTVHNSCRLANLDPVRLWLTLEAKLGGGVSDYSGAPELAATLPVVVTLRRGSANHDKDQLTRPQKSTGTESQRVDGLTLRWARGGVADTCLRTVKEQIYMQAALNQTYIPPLTQYTQTHKLAHT